MKIKITTAIILLSLVGCNQNSGSNAATAPIPAPVTKEDAQKARLEAQEISIKELLTKIVKSRLKDPDSAKFEEVTVYTERLSFKSGTILISGGSICGRVNSKNSFGGYTGSKDFVASVLINGTTGAFNTDPDLLTVAIDDPDDEYTHGAFKRAAEKNCVNIVLDKDALKAESKNE